MHRLTDWCDYSECSLYTALDTVFIFHKFYKKNLVFLRAWWLGFGSVFHFFLISFLSGGRVGLTHISITLPQFCIIYCITYTFMHPCFIYTNIHIYVHIYVLSTAVHLDTHEWYMSDRLLCVIIILGACQMGRYYIVKKCHGTIIINIYLISSCSTTKSSS